MIFKNQLSTSITQRYHNILGTIVEPGIKNGFLNYISKFGNLYYGNPYPDLFLSQFRGLKNSNLEKLINYQSITNSDILQSVRFILHMLRVAQKTQWRLPGLANEYPDHLQVTCGNSRIFASGICHQTPWEKVDFFVLQNKNTPANQYLYNPTLITTDDEFHQILNLPMDSDLESPLVELTVSWQPFNDVAKLVLTFIGDRVFENQATVGHEYFSEFVKWQNFYGKTPKIKIYTDWPELLSNSQNVWDVEIAGTSKHIYQTIFLPGHIERAIYNLHNEESTDRNTHIMHIIKPRPVDVAELLFWLDVNHTTFIDTNGEFIIYRPDQLYNSTFISLSQF